MIPVFYKRNRNGTLPSGEKRWEFIPPAREWKEFVTYEHSTERWYA